MQQCPRWSLASVYGGVNDEKFTRDLEELKASCGRVMDRCRALSDDPSALIELVRETETMGDLFDELQAYVYCRYSTDTRDKEALKGMTIVKEAGLAVHEARIAFTNAAASIGDAIPDLIAADPELGQYEYIFKELLEQQKHLMSPGEESLAADLDRSGAEAWSMLQEAVSSSASAPWEDGTKTVVELRSLAFEADRNVREKAYRKELEVWKQQEIPIAFAINGVKGTALSLEKRRKYAGPLEHALKSSRLTEDTLTALISVMEESLPIFRQYLKAKAKVLGIEKCAFFDLFAPVGESVKTWEYEEAKAYIIDQFGRFSPSMAELASKAFENSWIDAQPRAGKVGGAFCIGLAKSRESRVLCNFDGTFSSVTTLAHELGHAYHGHILKDEPSLLRDYPMPLAETASIFAETVIFNGQLAQSDDQERFSLIENFMQDAAQIVVDILSRFYFEKELFSRRSSEELSADDLCAIMLDAQKAAYGDGLDENLLHPYMWAVKPHYYRAGLSFYNFPYTFGMLFGLGLYAQYQQEGVAFQEKYDRLLKLTGRNDVKQVCASAGIEVEDPEFWRSGMGIIKTYADIFCKEA